MKCCYKDVIFDEELKGNEWNYAWHLLPCHFYVLIQFFRKTIIYVNCSERHSLIALIIMARVQLISFNCFVQRGQLLVYLTVRELQTFPVVTWLSALCWSNTRRGLECLTYTFLVRKFLNSNLVPDLLVWSTAWRTCSSTQTWQERKSATLFKVKCDQKVYVHLMSVLQSSGARRLFYHTVYKEEIKDVNFIWIKHKDILLKYTTISIKLSPK
jgi:hypothetical protein